MARNASRLKGGPLAALLRRNSGVFAANSRPGNRPEAGWGAA